MFIQTEPTPNPQTLKFLPGEAVLGEGTREFRSLDDAETSPLAQRLFAVPGVTGVFLGADFVSVTKDEQDWQHLKPAILGAIMEHYLSDAPVIVEGSVETVGDEFYEPTDQATVATIKELLEERVRPAGATAGGDITFRGFRDGTVFLQMQGACSGCPSSTATLRSGIENLLRHFVPGVEAVQDV